MQVIDTRRLAFSFKWGFIADRVVEVLKKMKKGHSLSDDDLNILKMSRKLLSMILEGEELANSGNFSMNFLESIKIYNRFISIKNTKKFLNIISESNTKDLIYNMDSNLNEVINNLNSTVNVDREIMFFDILRDITLDESQGFIDGLYESRGLRKWASLPRNIS